jgi:BirA family biotin operon repressor/biotin-[acetyl-CoA-carboxylase] ligase
VIDLAPFTGGPRERLLAALLETGEQYATREQLLDRTGVSPIELAPLLAELGDGGVPIETRPGAGHRLATRRPALDTARVNALVRAGGRWRSVLHLPAVTSTNSVAAALAASGEPGGVVVVAEAQTQGRGREGRSWYSPPGAGLWISLLVRPRLAASQAYWLTVCAALAGVRAARAVAGAALAIKWPNDLVAPWGAGAGAWRKAGGILAEARSRGAALDYGVVGIGMNVDLEEREYPPDLAARAASLRMLGGRPVDRHALLAALLYQMNETLVRVEEGDATSLLTEFRALSMLLGRPVTMRIGDRSVRGIVRDLDDQGALLLEPASSGESVEPPHRPLERVLAGEAFLEEA